MLKYATWRLLAAIPTVGLVLIGVFFLVRYLPGDLATLKAGEAVYSKDQLARLRGELGMDDPMYVQFWHYISNIAQGDFGHSAWTGRSIATELRHRGLITVEIGATAVVLSSLLGITIGTISAIKERRPVDYALRATSILGLSLPNFWVATMVVVVPTVLFDKTVPLRYTAFTDDPVANMEYILAPAIVLALSLSAITARYTRAMMLEVLRQDYVRTARAKGLSSQVVMVRHALRNAALPVITVIGLQVPILIGGSVVVEQIFSVPGLGTLTIQSLEKRDYPMLQGLNLVFAAFVIATNIAVDLSYRLLDPRVSAGRGS